MGEGALGVDSGMQRQPSRARYFGTPEWRRVDTARSNGSAISLSGRRELA